MIKTTIDKKRKSACLEAGMAFLLFLMVAAAGTILDQRQPDDAEDGLEAVQDVSSEMLMPEEKEKNALDKEETAVPGQYPIMGESVITEEQMIRCFEASGKEYPSEILGKGGAPDIQTFCRIYYEEALAEGVRPEVPFAQAMKETAWLQFGGDSKIEQFNFAGLGTTGNGVEGESFPDVRTGVRAQIQHLKAYASEEPLIQECVDTRYSLVKKGSAPYVEWLGQQENPQGQGWAVDPDYGNSIVTMIYSLEMY